MTNLEKMKATICNAINSMSEETFFEFMSEYDEDDETYFPKGAIFTCNQCHELYGSCKASEADAIDYSICKNRFANYCRTESE